MRPLASYLSAPANDDTHLEQRCDGLHCTATLLAGTLGSVVGLGGQVGGIGAY